MVLRRVVLARLPTRKGNPSVKHPRPRSWAVAAAMTLVVAGAAAPALTSSAGAAPGDRPATPGPVVTQPGVSVGSAARTKIAPGVARQGEQRQSVFVQLTGTGAADAARSSAARNGRSARSTAVSRRTEIQRTARAAAATARGKDSDAVTLFTTTNSLPGVGMVLDAAGIKAVAARSDVKKVSRIAPRTVQNSNVASFVKALNAWTFQGNTGKGVRVGVIDTGLDYTHADFGGIGTVAGFEAADAADTGSTWRDSLPALGRAKVAGGYDFAGDDYNADPSSPSYDPVPKPDPDPLDCNGHGTHVAGSVAGYGVTAAGKAYTGSYANLSATSLKSMDIGPGMAPQASLYGLRVFGCDGSTDLVVPALDWALDPNGDGDFSDHLDIVNMSLGSSYSPVDDPQNAIVDELSSHGVLTVASMGNEGDLTDVGGSPGSATSSLAVASTVDSLQQRDGLRVTAPSSVAGTVAGQMSSAYAWDTNGPTGQPVSGTVATVPGDNADGCDTFSAADAARVAGKVAWLEWDDDDATRRCGSAGRAAKAREAGAIGAIFTSSRDVFGAGILGDAQIPVLQLPRKATDQLRPAAEAGTLQVTFDGALRATIKDYTASIADTISSFTSRGPHGSVGVVKPDVAAPGDTISSAGVGTGNKVLVESGTSMAAPVTAGTAALVKAAHPTWSPAFVKAAVMNTAGHDLYTGGDRTGDKYGPNRVGAGRIDAAYAASTQVIAYTSQAGNPVSASFGVVPAPVDGGTVTLTKKVAVRNFAKGTSKVALAYDAVVRQPGVRYTVSPSTLAVPGGQVRSATVTMTVDPTALRHTIDPTMETTQLESARQYLSDASGRLLVTPTGKPALRVPVHGAAKPVATTTSTVRNGQVVTTGTGVSQGTGSTAYKSFSSVLELGARSGQLPVCVGGQTSGCVDQGFDRSNDLQYVGAGATDDLLWFGVATWGDWANIGNVGIPYVDYDTDGDGTADYETYLQNFAGSDVLYAATVDLATGEAVDYQPVNFNEGNVDTNVFDTNVALLPVSKRAVGLPTDGSSAPITYTVGTADAAYGGTTDSTGSIAFDAGTPRIATAGPLFEDQGGTAIDLTGTGGADALVLHLSGARGQRAQVLEVE